MKYIEQTKSFLLTFLVLLSVTLTLMIWSYKPDYELIEESKVEEILIGETKELKDVLKPYRALFRQNDEYYGTVSTNVINSIYDQLSTIHTSQLNLINSDLTDAEINEILRMNNQVTLFFNEEIPIQIFANLLSISDKEVPDASFTRLLVDWSGIEANDQVQLLFLNTEKRTLFRASADVPNTKRFLAEVTEPAKTYSPYTEVERDSLLSLYVTQDPLKSTKYTYFIDETHTDKFKNLLFSDPNIVKGNIESAQSEKYTDGTSLMTVDKQNRIFNYVYPPAESIALIPSERLLSDSFDFVNDHGGFTVDYRLSTMNIGKHMTEYQMFLHGYPIYSNMTMTRIVTTWGENRIFRYRRPYYSIESNADIPSERTVKQLSSGTEVIAGLQNDSESSFEDIDDLVVGYYLTQDLEKDLFLLEPSWFIISNNSWTRILPEHLGGIDNGLE
ncbi:hypothetical protein DCE79_18260 [Lysinibacillus sp. 2017]|uniref:YycH family regulatory protein n=1 Tax=unclassified Lysinibacillus TaxID=2636778 RepID=UPI000D526571|nr:MULTISPECIES: two-component system activity regulator YycH [unclassified Lysinibacillus]AWE09160.1 hypothetical protein DCE79_18260 [Lysinibacillus sp. 2017]TGN35985.1 hypothetical protein E4L99_07525 [Lysinibacillus sp. S2017]